jgi:hypothetical protein
MKGSCGHDLKGGSYVWQEKNRVGIYCTDCFKKALERRHNGDGSEVRKVERETDNDVD